MYHFYIPAQNLFAILITNISQLRLVKIKVNVTFKTKKMTDYEPPLMKLYEAYGLPNESFEDYVERYTEEEKERKEYDERERGMNDYYCNID